MPYIGNIVQDFSVNTAMLNSDSVTSIKIDDGTIVNADVNDSAAIAGTKINPSFGSQTISVVSDQTNPSLQISGNGPNYIRFLDSGGTSTSIDLAFRTSSNRLQFENAGSAANIFSLDVDDNQATFAGNVDIASGLDVTGNITVTDRVTCAAITISDGQPGLVFEDTGANPDFILQNRDGTFAIRDFTSNVNRFLVNAGNGDVNVTGNLSIGTTSPAAKFHAADTAATVACLQRTSSTANVVLRFQNDTSSMFCGLTSTATGFAIDDDNDLGSGPMLFVRRSDGNLGVGTASPAGTLSLSDQNPNIRFDDEDTSNNAEITLDNTQLRIEIDEDNSVNNSALKFRIDGSDKAVITSAGNLGLGTTTLAALSGDSGRLLHLAGANNPEIVLERTTSGTEAKASFRISNNKDLIFAIKDGSASTIDALTIDSTSGGVGIGTVTPTTRLQVGDGTVDSSNVIKLGKRISSSNTNLPLIGHHSDGTGSGIGICATSANGAIHFFTGNGASGFGASNNAERMIITSGGNVGIGTSSPDVDFHVSGGSSVGKIESTTSSTSARLIIKSANDTYTGIHFGDDADDDVGRIRYYHNTDHMHFSTNATERMRIDSIGRVGIGTTSPASLLHIADATEPAIRLQDTNAANSDFKIYSPNGNNSLRIYHENTSSDLFHIASGGDVGIGTTSPAKKLDVNGEIRATGILFGSDTASGNALDDYEEGSLTWQLKKSDETSGSNNGAVVKYVKVGRLVHISGRIRTDSTGSSGSGFFEFTSGSTLPFTPETNGTSVIGHFRSQDQEDSSLTASIAWQSNSTTLYMYTIDTRADYTASTNNVPVSSQTNLVITFSLTYRANS